MGNPVVTTVVCCLTHSAPDIHSQAWKYGHLMTLSESLTEHAQTQLVASTSPSPTPSPGQPTSYSWSMCRMKAQSFSSRRGISEGPSQSHSSHGISCHNHIAPILCPARATSFTSQSRCYSWELPINLLHSVYFPRGHCLQCPPPNNKQLQSYSGNIC